MSKYEFAKFVKRDGQFYELLEETSTCVRVLVALHYTKGYKWSPLWWSKSELDKSTANTAAYYTCGKMVKEVEAVI